MVNRSKLIRLELLNQIQMTCATNPMNVEDMLLAEVATWTTGSELDFVLTKCAAPGFYNCRLHGLEAHADLPLLLELSLAEAVIFNQHMTFPATRADLEDLPQRLRVAKLRELIT